MRALLDVNVLIALTDSQHIHHETAHAWLHAHGGEGWASCPLTLNGCIRILAQPAYGLGWSTAQVARLLRTTLQSPQHEFWPDDLNPLASDTLDFDHLLGQRQMTDAYLLALAVRHGGRLVTLDARLDPRTARGAQQRHLVRLLGAAD
ncbi:MAG: PIN domain-containing protein [Pseudomonadota bacterium]|nr:PIN domain-containing protein [Pseudomonadota bacterium]